MIIVIMFVLCVIGLIYGAANGIGWLVYTSAVLAITLVLYGCVAWAIADQKRWAEFAKEHNCKIVRKETGSHHSGVAIVGGKPGFGSSYTPGKTTYLCDDGIEYVR